MNADNRGVVAKYSRVLRKALSSKHVFAFLTRHTLARTATTRALFNLHLQAASPEAVAHGRLDPGSPIEIRLPIDAGMERHLRAFSEDLGPRLADGCLTLSADLRVYEMTDCEILPWLGVTLHRPTDRVIEGSPDAQPRLVSRVREIPGKVLSLLDTPRGHHHYFHFFERLAVLLRVLRWAGPDQPLTLVVREEQTPFQTAAYAILPKRFANLRVMAIAEDERVRPERLLVSRLSLAHPLDRFALAEEWREIGGLYRQAYGLVPDATRRKIHLTRRGQRLRRILNEAALEPVFARHGFETIAPETLSHTAQVALMMQADAIVAVSGAAITNILFAARPIRLTIICPREIDVPFWEPLVLLLGHAMDYVEGDTATWNDHFTVDPAKLDAALTRDARVAAP
jgi:hypothetical protein